MANVKLSYNPYKVETQIVINNTPEDFGRNSKLSYVKDKRLQEWLDERKGIFAELQDASGDNALTIDFVGTREDYLDLQEKFEKLQGSNDSIKLRHANKKQAKRIDNFSKKEELKKLFEKLQNGPVEEFRDPKIKKNFEEALNSEFEIVVIAPMSSGKSTLINAMIGHDYLPAFNKPTTAVITKIKDDDNAECFTVSAYDIYGEELSKNANLTKELISDLNSRIDPKDIVGKRPLLRKIEIVGNIPNLNSNILQTVFVDTPGGNSAENKEHTRIMNDAIKDESHSLILFVFNGTNATTDDSEKILDNIASSMRNGNNCKLSRDRFLFVANKMDEYDPEKEGYEETINELLQHLKEKGIYSPNLFLVSAEAAKLARMSMCGDELTKHEKSKIKRFKETYEDEDASLIKYASLDAESKEILMGEAETVIEQLSNAKDEMLRDKLALKCVELNSGIPALEKAISIYLKKYAFAIKIKKMHDSFMKIVNERKMVAELEKACDKDKKTRLEVISKLKNASKVLKNNKQKQVFKDSINGIQVDYSPIKQARAKIVAKIQEISEKCPEKLKKNQAEMELLKITESFKKIDEYVEKEMQEAFAGGALLNCKKILVEYKAYIQELDKEGVLNIGELDFKETSWFDEDIDLNSMIAEYTSIENEEIRTGVEEEEGFWAAIKRVLGIGGYRIKKVYEDEEYILVKELVTNVITECQGAFDKNIDKKQESIKKFLKDLKSMVISKMSDLEDKISEQTADLEKLLSDEKALDKKVKEDNEKCEWTKKFIDDVDRLLSIEE